MFKIILQCYNNLTLLLQYVPYARQQFSSLMDNSLYDLKPNLTSRSLNVNEHKLTSYFEKIMHHNRII